MEDYFKIFSFIKTPNKVLLIILLLLVIWLMTRKPKKYPPGPLKWPIVGNMFQMRVKGKIHLGMKEMSRKYGEVVGMFAGNSPVILISGLDALKEATTRDDLNGRAPNEFQKILNNGHIYGFSAISGDPWKIQRRFTLHHLRDFGFGKSSLEVVIHDEIKALFRIVDHISGGAKENFSKPFSFHDILSAPLINTLWFMMSGQRYEHDHPKFKRLTCAVKDFLHNIPAEGGMINAYPTVAKLLPGISKLRIMQQARDALHKIIQEEIDDHRKTIDYENPRDFIDTYIREIDKQKADPTTTFNEEQLKQICMDLFLGGTDTTYNSILAVILRMVVYPEIQSKVHEELDQVIGRGRLPSLEDKAKLPYLEATIHESQRLNFVSPVGVPRAPVTDKEEIFFRGYNIPKESRILFDLFGLAHDPKYWHETKEFKPERFLNQNGRVFQPEAFIPFSSVPPTKPAGYEYFPGVGYYKFYPYGVSSFNEAINICQNDGAHLAIINSVAESEVLKLIYARYPKAKEWAYVGFHDQEEEGKFVTIFGEPLSSTGYIKWHPGTPDQHQGNEDCGSMHRTGGLNDIGCDNSGSWPFFCEFDLSWSLN